MQGKVDEQQSNDIEAEFGYYPVEVNVETDDFSLLTLPGLAEKTNLINNHRNVINGWIYPGNQEVYNLNGGISTMPTSIWLTQNTLTKIKKYIFTRNSQFCCVVSVFFQRDKINNY